ncbi:MAG: hypothetical protein RDV48_31210 [Candidatus Eremiobacteraeota bacterium]|nr:hypothetical protein [Candidatus Eremiobacteraeota bacterium]
MTGRSMTSIRMMIKRGRNMQAKKVMDNKRELWLVHRDTVEKLGGPCSDQAQPPDHHPDHDDQRSSSDHQQVIGILADMLDKQRKELTQERDQAVQGMMMYRYKFEELDRVVKALPAPPELITEEIRQKDSLIKEAQKVLNDAQYAITHKESALAELKQKLDEAERAKEHLRESWERAMADLKRPWWKKALIAAGMWK